ncbi:MAG: uroporphyrinogen decarboxylase family protein [Spirochaetia bacterium]
MCSNKKKNILKAVRFEEPDYIPMTFHINDACWNHYSHDELFNLMESHKFLFPEFKKPKGDFKPNFHAAARKDNPFTDDWGCVWETSEDGITGVVTVHPLSDWSSFPGYQAPDPDRRMGLGPINWKAVETEIENTKKQGGLAVGGLRHGHTFLQICDIRGYQNVIFDMADDDPRLKELISMVEDFNMRIVNRYLSMDVDMITYAEDLGMQNGPMISPEHFRKFIKPSYKKIMAPAQEKGTIIHMHSDGCLHDLIDDIMEGGVDVINLQDLVNGIDWIADKLGGKVCVELDIDRQNITAKGTPEMIDNLVREEVEKLGSRKGGLMMIYGLYPGIPLKNVKALMDAMEKYAFYH